MSLLKEMREALQPLPAANFPHMNTTQIHERLRQELLRRIQRGSLSVSLLARQTGFGQAHISNFLRNRRQLSLSAIDRVLNAQHLTIADFLPVVYPFDFGSNDNLESTIPVVSHTTAQFEPTIRPGATQSLLHLPANAIQEVRARVSHSRRSWERFVAVRIPAVDALPMEPVVLPEAIVLIDRHYNSLRDYRPNRANLYAVRLGAHLTLRYADFQSNRLVLRPHNLAFPVEVIEVAPGESANDLLVGRIALILNPG